jgi:hypothetical protein
VHISDSTVLVLNLTFALSDLAFQCIYIHSNDYWYRGLIRLLKENGLYRDEVEENKKKEGKLRAEGAEDWDIKNAVSI